VKRLPPLPPTLVETVREHAAPGPGFLRLHRVDLAVGPEREPFVYDYVTRVAMDAAVVVPHFLEDGVRYVLFRSCVRPPLALRGVASSALWELPAGLVEEEEDPRETAARELLEETGVDVAAMRLASLGAPVWVSPGVIPERLWFFHVEIEPVGVRRAGDGDATPLERGGLVAPASIDEALARSTRGELGDMKTELGLRRLLAHLEGAP
jgi:ADP-ribose pyrophosphatase